MKLHSVLIASIVGAAPRLGDMLALQPRLMDGLVDPRFFGAMPRREEISQRLKTALADADSYEEFLDRLRLFGQESLFLIGSRILSGTVSAQLAGIAFADVAEGIVETIHALVTSQFAEQHGVTFAALQALHELLKANSEQLQNQQTLLSQLRQEFAALRQKVG